MIELNSNIFAISPISPSLRARILVTRLLSIRLDSSLRGNNFSKLSNRRFNSKSLFHRGRTLGSNLLASC